MSPVGGGAERNGHEKDSNSVAELCDKILQNLNNAFEKDDLLDEFDIIPCESKLNQSPVLHDQAAHKLALESWCVPYLYKHSYHQFLWICRKVRRSSIYSSNSKPRGESGSAGGVGDLVNCASSKRDKEISRKLSGLSESERISRGLLLSRILVIINPDLNLAWNYRRDFFHPSTLEMLKKEQTLVSLVMSRKPKCPEGFTYRRWLIRKSLEEDLVDQSGIYDFICEEIDMVEEPIRRYSTNYHAWSYRFWLLELVLTYDKTIIARDQKELLLDQELQKSSAWLKSNVSDYSGCHYRQKLLEYTLIFGTHGIPLLIKELDDNEKRIFLYEGHESLWHHRRAIIHLCMKRIQQFKDEEEGNVSGGGKTPPSSAGGRFENWEMLERRLQQKERDLIQQVDLKQSVDNECSTLNLKLCQGHIKWMERRLKWDLTKSVHSEL